jgi:hypothetical protein
MNASMNVGNIVIDRSAPRESDLTLKGNLYSFHGPLTRYRNSYLFGRNYSVYPPLVALRPCPPKLVSPACQVKGRVRSKLPFAPIPRSTIIFANHLNHPMASYAPERLRKFGPPIPRLPYHHLSALRT